MKDMCLIFWNEVVAPQGNKGAALTRLGYTNNAIDLLQRWRSYGAMTWGGAFCYKGTALTGLGCMDNAINFLQR